MTLENEELLIEEYDEELEKKWAEREKTRTRKYRLEKVARLKREKQFGIDIRNA